ncbi:MAG: TetR/AcrR family transcriptional regulator [Acidimicrobiia bacterium]|nr:TetR/AcrR family transcriptional regulator [Acidimicrobiia bacterium]
MPKQARSQETFDRFLDAVESLLIEREYAEITIADIVERAERTVGSFYTRFADKNAALVALVERTWAEELPFVERHLDPRQWAGRSLEEIVREGVTLTLAAYRNPQRPLRSFVLLALQDPLYRARRAEMLRDLATAWKAVVLTREHEIGHPEPSVAVDRSYQHLIGVLDHLLLFGPMFPVDEVDDDRLVDDLVTTMLRILRGGDRAETADAV